MRKKLYEIQEKIIQNIKNNDNYKEYSCYKVNEYYSLYGLENEHGDVVVPPYSVALTSQEEPDLYGVSEYPDVKIIPSLEDNGEINLNLKISEGIAQEFRLSDLFKDIETDDIYENTQDFASFKEIESEFKMTLDNSCDYRHHTTITSMQHIYDDHNHPEINETFQETTGNYDLYSRKLDYKEEKYKIISCDKKGKVDGYDLYLQDENSEFYNYVEDLQTIKSDSKYKNFNFEFNAERAVKVRELTKLSNVVVEDEDDVDLSIKQACFENIIRKMTEQNNGMER